MTPKPPETCELNKRQVKLAINISWGRGFLPSPTRINRVKGRVNLFYPVVNWVRAYIRDEFIPQQTDLNISRRPPKIAP